MFRDLKEYQQIQKIYNENVYISDEQKIITSIFEQQEFTEEELAYVKENLEEVFDLVCIEILEEARDGKFLKEEIITEEDEKLLTEMLIGEGIGTMIRTGLKAARPLAKKAVGAVKAGVKKAAPVVKKAAGKAVEVAKSAAGKVKQGVKAVVNNPTVRRAASAVGKAALATTGVGAAALGIKKGIDALRNRNKNKQDNLADKGKGTAGDAAIKGSGKEIPQAKPLSDPKTAKGQLQQKNIERFGKDRVQKLRDKNAAFQASKNKNSEYSRADFIKDFPNSNAAKEARKRKQRPNIMDYESFNPSYDHDTANNLAEIYRNMYDTPSEESEKKNLDEGKGYIAKKVVGTVINKALKNPKNINAVRAAGLTAGGAAVYAPIVGTAVAPKTTQKVIKGVVDKVKSAVPGKKKEEKKDMKENRLPPSQRAGSSKSRLIQRLRDKKANPNANAAASATIRNSGALVTELKAAPTGGRTAGAAAVAGSKGPKGGKGKPSADPKGGRYHTGHPVKMIDGKPTKLMPENMPPSYYGGKEKKKKAVEAQQKKYGTKGSVNEEPTLIQQVKVKQPAATLDGGKTYFDPTTGNPIKMPKKKKPSMKEDYTPYDLVLEYLLSTEQAATIEEANYIMTEMDAKTIQDIVSQQLNEQN